MSVQAFLSGEKHLSVVIGLRLLDHPRSLVANWQSPQSINEIIDSFINTHRPETLDIIWSAGKAGFSSTDEDMRKEFETYSAIIKHLKNIEVKVSFNLLSSAGGIYENSGAYWKLKQEDLLHELNINARIYRISSVYGYKTKLGRSGLINAMIEKSLRREPVTIYANQNTLRDYIFHTAQIIANGRATSINTLLNVVSSITKKPIKAVYTGNDNSNDIIFKKSLIPPTLQLTSLEEAIGIVYSRERFL